MITEERDYKHAAMIGYAQATAKAYFTHIYTLLPMEDCRNRLILQLSRVYQLHKEIEGWNDFFVFHQAGRDEFHRLLRVYQPQYLLAFEIAEAEAEK